MATLDSVLAESQVRREAEEQGVDPNVAVSIFRSENGGKKQVDTMTTSPMGAMGIMQVMPATLQGLIKKGFLQQNIDYASPQGQIKAGVAAIKERMAAGITDPVELAVSYNASPQVLANFRAGKAIPAETSAYIQNFSKSLGLKMNTATTETGTSTTSSKVIPPEVQAGLESSMSRASKLGDNLIGLLSGLKDQLLGNSRNTQAAVATVGEQSANLATAEGQQKLDTLNSRNDVLSVFGINLNDPGANQGLLENTKTVQAAMAARAPIDQQLTALQSTDPLQDPLGWFVNNIKAMPLVESRNALVRQENAAAENIQRLQSLAANQSALQPADTARAIQDQTYAQAKLAEAQAKVKIGELEGQAVQNISRTVNEQMVIANADVSQRLAFAKLMAERFATTYGATERETAVTKQAKDDQDAFDLTNLMLSTIGVKPVNKSTIRAYDKDTQTRMVKAGMSGVWGRDLAESVSTIHEIAGDAGMQRLLEQQPVVGKFLQQVVQGGKQELDAAINVAATNPNVMMELKQQKTDADRLQYGISIWQKKKEDELKARDFSRLSMDNPAKIDYGATANLPNLANNMTAKYVQAYAANGAKGMNIVIDDKLLLANAVAAVQLDPKSLSKVAVDLFDFYNVGTATKSMNIGVKQMGWNPPTFKGGRDYPVQASVTTFSNKPVQLLNPASIEQWITQQVAASASTSAIAAGLSGLN